MAAPTSATSRQSTRSSRSPCTMSHGQSGAVASSIGTRFTGGATVTSAAGRAVAHACRATAAPNEKPASHRRSQRQRARAQAITASASSTSPRPSSCSPSLCADAAEVEAHRRCRQLLHGPRQRVDDLVLHRAAVERMRMTDDANARADRDPGDGSSTRASSRPAGPSISTACGTGARNASADMGTIGTHAAAREWSPRQRRSGRREQIVRREQQEGGDRAGEQHAEQHGCENRAELLASAWPSVATRSSTSSRHFSRNSIRAYSP